MFKSIPRFSNSFLLSLVFLSLILFSFLMSPAKAQQVDLSETPERLADALNIPLIGGQMLATLIVSCLTLFPTFLLTKGKENATIATLFVGLGTWGFCLGVGWLPIFFFVVIVLLVVMLYAPKITNTLTGKGD